MPLHDQMALNARLDGQTSGQYRHAAQRHANAMWIYIIIAGVVWYFASWIWALIPFALAAFVATQSVSATLIARRLEKYESR
jgi:Flp pilus assembly protein TadB